MHGRSLINPLLSLVGVGEVDGSEVRDVPSGCAHEINRLGGTLGEEIAAHDLSALSGKA